MKFYEKYSSKSDLFEIQTTFLANIVRCYTATQQFDLAKLNFEKAIIIQETITANDEIKLASLYENIALCYWSTKDYDLTIQHYQIAFDLTKKISLNNIDIIKVYKQIGVCYDENKEYELARENYHKALEIQDEMLESNQLFITEVYSLLGSKV